MALDRGLGSRPRTPTRRAVPTFSSPPRRKTPRYVRDDVRGPSPKMDRAVQRYVRERIAARPQIAARSIERQVPKSQVARTRVRPTDKLTGAARAADILFKGAMMAAQLHPAIGVATAFPTNRQERRAAQSDPTWALPMGRLAPGWRSGETIRVKTRPMPDDWEPMGGPNSADDQWRKRKAVLYDMDDDRLIIGEGQGDEVHHSDVFDGFIDELHASGQLKPSVKPGWSAMDNIQIAAYPRTKNPAERMLEIYWRRGNEPLSKKMLKKLANEFPDIPAGSWSVVDESPGSFLGTRSVNEQERKLIHTLQRRRMKELTAPKRGVRVYPEPSFGDLRSPELLDWLQQRRAQRPMRVGQFPPGFPK